MVIHLLVFFLLVALSVPISIALGLTAIVFAIAETNLPLLVIVQRMFTGIDSFPLMAIPFFILAGNLMNTGGVTQRLIAFCNVLVGFLRGGLAAVSIVGSMIFAGISGSSVADASGLGSILIPAMKKEGYDPNYSAAINATSSTVGVIVPPSIPMVLLGVVASVSVRDLFIGGALPGIAVAGTLMAISTFISYKRGYPKHDRASFAEAVKITLRCLPALMMPAIIIGGIIFGIFTPTEAAVIAVIYALVVGLFIYQELSLKKIIAALNETGIQTAVVLLVIATASVISWLLSYNMLPQKLAQWVQTVFPSETGVLAVIAVIGLVAGTVIDMAPAIILFGSVFTPVATRVGCDPVHFGVTLVFALAIGLFTPPVGTTLIISCYIAKTSMFDAFKACLPFLLGMLVLLGFLVLFKNFALFLPNLLFH
jgi:tripartite ATP-independent transporter DctM subunit